MRRVPRHARRPSEWMITAPGSQRMLLQISYLDRSHDPVTMDVGPCSTSTTWSASKVVALASRAAENDYVDTAAAMDRGYTINQLMSLARALDPGLEERDLAEAGDRLDRIEDDELARSGRY